MDIAARRRPLCRARLVIRRATATGPEVLLAHHVRPDRAFWCFPGGGVEPGEAFTTAAVREAREETSLAVTLLGLCWVEDRVAEDALELFYLADAATGEATLGGDPEVGDGPAILAALRWVPLRDLGALSVLPRGLAAALAEERLGPPLRLLAP